VKFAGKGKSLNHFSYSKKIEEMSKRENRRKYR